ncbi:MAG: GerW family sporulation protein, partial [Armatimonadota bacterium]
MPKNGQVTVEELLNRIGQMHEKATVKTVFGEPMHVEGRTIVPVARVRYMFGLGMGRGTAESTEGAGSGGGEGGGGGGGVTV